MDLVDSVELYLEECLSKITVKTFFSFFRDFLYFVMLSILFFTFEYFFIL